MWLDPRRSAGALWIAWVAAGALGGGLATLLSLAWMGSWLDGNAGELATFAYGIAFALVAAALQYVVLRFVAGRTRTVILWLPATAVAYVAYLWLNQLWMTNIDKLTALRWLDPGTTFDVISWGSNATYALALGCVQGVVLVLMTGRKVSLALWVGANLLGLLMSFYVPQLIPVAPQAAGVRFVAESAMFTGSYALATGLALIVILRRWRRRMAVPAMAAAPTLQGEG